MLAIITICQVQCSSFQAYKIEADLAHFLKNLNLDIFCHA